MSRRKIIRTKALCIKKIKTRIMSVKTGKEECAMNSLKNGLQFLAVLALLAILGLVAWYLLFCMSGSDSLTDGTLVKQTFDAAERLVIM